MMKGIVRSARGEAVNMFTLASQNAGAVALGNANMNARGDIVDKSGNVLKSREVIVQEYYASNPKAVTQSVSLKDLGEEVLTIEQMRDQLEIEAPKVQKAQPKKRKIIEDETE
jgi:hypothetical protein